RRTRRDSAMPSRSMICFARTLPTPGMDWRTAETFIFARTGLPAVSGLPAASAMTSCRVTVPRLRRSLTSARCLRASAAFRRAFARCSSVSGGSAMVLVLLFAWGRAGHDCPVGCPVPVRCRASSGPSGLLAAVLILIRHCARFPAPGAARDGSPVGVRAGSLVAAIPVLPAEKRDRLPVLESDVACHVLFLLFGWGRSV